MPKLATKGDHQVAWPSILEQESASFSCKGANRKCFKALQAIKSATTTQCCHRSMKATTETRKQMSGAMFQYFIYGHKSEFHVTFTVMQYYSSFDLCQPFETVNTILNSQTIRVQARGLMQPTGCSLPTPDLELWHWLETLKLTHDRIQMIVSKLHWKWSDATSSTHSAELSTQLHMAVVCIVEHRP